MVMEKITVEEAKKIAKERGLRPGRVKGTKGIQFTKGKNPRIEVIDWDEFENTLKGRGLAVWNWNGWMKIRNK